ncbi:MAG TPA: hypothetical protein DCF42_01455 [Lachnospiraceae bacterium]|nr:hypothetical protein [Lachnospiraceae bacterium]
MSFSLKKIEKNARFSTVCHFSDTNVSGLQPAAFQAFHTTSCNFCNILYGILNNLSALCGGRWGDFADFPLKLKKAYPGAACTAPGYAFHGK